LDPVSGWLLQRERRGRWNFLQGPNDLLLEQALRFGFKPSNNQAKYEPLIAGLTLAADMGADTVTCRIDSQLIVGHLDDTFQVNDPLLL